MASSSYAKSVSYVLTDHITTQSHLRERMADYMAEVRKGGIVTVFGGSHNQPHLGGVHVCLIRRDALADLINAAKASEAP